MLADFTIVMAYYENPTMLVNHMIEWSKWDDTSRNRIQVIIVDDGSQDCPAIDVIKRCRPDKLVDMLCFRIDVDIPWNQDGARNLGMKHVTSRWCLLTDMDHMVTSDQARALFRHWTDKGVDRHYYMPMRRQQWDDCIANPHPNSYIIQPKDFWSMGGYDEDFAGCYGSDGNFRKNMRAGLKEETTHNVYLTQFRRQEFPDSGTNRYSRKDGPYYRANFPHLEAKRRGPAYKAVNHIRFPWHQEQV